MMLRPCLVFVACCLVSTSVGWAQSTEPESVPPIVEHETLVEFGQDVADTESYLDNYFQYEEQVETLTNRATEMAGAAVEVTARVTRVTPVEVFVNVIDAGKMRMVLRHATPPCFGNLGTRWYGGTPSTQRAFLFSKRVGLRIGEEIDLELAKKLRRGDMLYIAGRIEQVEIRIKQVFEPFVAAIVTEWKIADADLKSEDELTAY